MELKWASALKHDLNKLSEFQDELRKRHGVSALAWMVYGDHFNKDVHAANYRAHLKREEQIRRWARREPVLRGPSIIHAGVSSPSDSPGEREVRALMNEAFWDRDCVIAVVPTTSPKH
jgi:hypothetical protein